MSLSPFSVMREYSHPKNVRLVMIDIPSTDFNKLQRMLSKKNLTIKSASSAFTLLKSIFIIKIFQSKVKDNRIRFERKRIKDSKEILNISLKYWLFFIFFS